MRQLRHAVVIGIAVGTLMAVASGAQAHRKVVSFSPGEMSITGGGGVQDFVSSRMRSVTQLGAEWDARVLFGTKVPIAFEAGYVGTYNALNSASFGSSGVAPFMLNNGVDGALRINLLPWRVDPFIFGGLGYNHAQIMNRADNVALASQFRRQDDQLIVLAGAGLAGYLGKHAALDARFTYRAVFLDDINIVDHGRQDQWVVSARAGYAF